jgi:uncharacterized protein DUF4238
MRHHFIPAFYLRQWHGPDNKLVEYAIKRGKLLPKRASADATGFERDLYEYPELPSPLSQFLEKQFFNYADRTAAWALEMLLDGRPKHLWSNEMLSAWARFLVGVHTRHFDTIPEIRDAAKTLWAASGEQSQWIYEEIREPEDPPTFDEWISLRDPLIPIRRRSISWSPRWTFLLSASTSLRCIGRLSKSPRRRVGSSPPIGHWECT